MSIIKFPSTLFKGWWGFQRGNATLVSLNVFALGGGVLAAALGKHNSPPCEPQRAKLSKTINAPQGVNEKTPQWGVFSEGTP